MGSVPDGVYEVFDNVVKITSDWSDAQRERLTEELTKAQEQSDARAARRALRRSPDLFAYLQRLIVPSNPAEFWALVAAILAALALHH